MLLTPLINSYRFNERHSLWYLLPVIQTTDPALFAADPVVASIALFRSVFYDGLSYLVSILEISPSNLPLFLKALSIIVQAGIVGLLFAISRRLSPNLWVFTFLAAWACQQRSAIIGGDQTFTSTLTHREVAELLGLAAVYLMLCGRALQASLVLSFTVFIHVLVAIHLFVAMVPAIVLRKEASDVADGARSGGVCRVCAVLRAHLGTAPNGRVGPTDFPAGEGRHRSCIAVCAIMAPMGRDDRTCGAGVRRVAARRTKRRQYPAARGIRDHRGRVRHCHGDSLSRHVVRFRGAVAVVAVVYVGDAFYGHAARVGDVQSVVDSWAHRRRSAGCAGLRNPGRRAPVCFSRTRLDIAGRGGDSSAQHGVLGEYSAIRHRKQSWASASAGRPAGLRANLCPSSRCAVGGPSPSLAGSLCLPF